VQYKVVEAISRGRATLRRSSEAIFEKATRISSLPRVIMLTPGRQLNTLLVGHPTLSSHFVSSTKASKVAVIIVLVDVGKP
jgi:hypothetical protein